MKLASFQVGDRPSWGVVEGATVRDVGAVLGAVVPDLRTALASAEPGRIRAAAADAPSHAADAVAWLPVIPNPDKILCVGTNYAEHRAETGRAASDHPTIFVRFASSQAAHLADLIRPRVSTMFDFEAELAVVIGRRGRHIAPADALAHVAGVAPYNDGSIRDWQRHTHQFTPGKNFPRTGGFGPALVTLDETGPLAPLRIVSRVNGATMQDARLGDMIFDVATIIAYCSTFTELVPGDVIATGTPGGVGSRRDPPVWLVPGDVVEVEIERVGLLRNGVAAET